MRGLAGFLLFALLGAFIGPISPSSRDCYPMGGDISCCPDKDAAEAGCGLRRCAQDGADTVAPQLPRATLETPASNAPTLESQPLLLIAFDCPDSIAPDPELPPPRA